MPAVPLLSRSTSSYVRVLSWLAMAWIIVFWRLGYPSLMDPDEAHYAEPVSYTHLTLPTIYSV